MPEELFSAASRFFRKVNESSEAQLAMKKHHRRVQFEIKGEEPFYLDVKDGRLEVKKGMLPPGGLPEPARFTTTREALEALFAGRLRFTHAYFPEKRDDLKIRLTGGVPGGTFGGVVVGLVARLFRIGQELR
ncbi:MAG: SCP2 sterol-binding domain-containing protein [Chloroflexi bacterium]|nr:SCP2 sterol-binding domain-containing protein [Chloroflexota bacterium]